MTAIAPVATKPQPLPDTGKAKKPEPMPVNSIKDWEQVPLVDISWKMTKGEQTSLAKDSLFASFAVSGLEGFQKIQAKNLKEAVLAASEFSRKSLGKSTSRTGDDYKFTAPGTVGVLQAQDGAWYATFLSSKRGAKDSITMAAGVTTSDGWTINIDEATNRIPAVKALVGLTQWVNFTDEKLKLNLA